jgi:cytochrome c-type biogenesis protein CcmF
LPVFPLLALVSIGMFSRWKRGGLADSKRRILGSFLLAAAIGLGVIMGIYGDRSLLGPIGVVLGVWIIVSSLIDPVDRLRRGLTLSAAVLGMTMAHIGLGVLAIGVTTMQTRMLARDVAMHTGDQVKLGDYAFTFDSIKDIEGPNYSAKQAKVTVTRDGKLVDTLLPERRTYWVQQQSLAEAALGVSWTRDLLVTMGEELGNDSWSLRVQVRPLMRFVWLGAVLMALGGLLSTIDRRYRRLAVAAQTQALADSPPQSPPPQSQPA